MKPTIPLFVLLAACLAVSSGARQEPATETGDEEPAVDPLVQLTQPGEHHEHLDRLVGDWDLTIRVWPSPDAEPIESAGTAEARWILGGRFLWTIYRAELFGRPFEAWSVEGYDNQARQYVGTWRDTQGTYTLIYAGNCQQPPATEGEAPAEVPAVPDGTFRVMTTQITDPVSAETLQVRTELRVEADGGGFVQESFVVLTPEEPIKNLELVGTRRGG